MNDDTTNFDPVDLSPTRAELIARVRSRGRQIRARRRLATAGVAALVVVAVAVPAIAIGTRSSSHSVPPATGITTTPSTSIAPPPAALSAHTELAGDSFVAGSTIHGTLVIDNTTGKPVTLEHPGECTGKWAVALTNATTPPDVPFTMECGSKRTVLATGVTRFPFSLPTTYHVCSPGGGSGPGMRRCLPDGSMPPLPAGSYQAVVVDSFDGRFPVAPGVPVRLVP